MSLILTPAEVDELTAYPDGTPRAHLDSRLRALDAIGIKYKVRGRHIIVSRPHAEAVLADRQEPSLAVDNVKATEEYDVDFKALAEIGYGQAASQR